MKKIISIVLALATVMSLSIPSLARGFKDVDEKHQNYTAIETLNTLGVVNGYDEREYGVNDKLTRSQLCTMLVRAIYGDFDIHYNTTSFNDVPLDYWARKYIDTARDYHLMNGYNESTFGPDDRLTYTQTARVILNILGYGELEWPTGVNSLAYELRLYDNVYCTSFDNTCTRGHAAQMIYNAFNCHLVKEYSNQYVTTNKTFLQDILNYTSIIEKKNGHEYVAYKNYRGEKFVTNLTLTYSKNVIIDKEGKKYLIPSSHKSYNIDWKKVDLYVDGILDNTNYGDIKGKNVEGIFSKYTNELIAIYYITPGKSYTPKQIETIPGALKELLLHDKNYSPEYSTITYWESDNYYIISNKVEEGFVQKLQHISEKTWYIKLSNGFEGNIIENGETVNINTTFMRIFIDYKGSIIDYTTLQK